MSQSVLDDLYSTPHHNVQGLLDGITLYPYQIKTINWMINRELEGVGGNSNEGDKGVVISGGIKTVTSHSMLCDEMGLGKTVEVMGCILGNECVVSGLGECMLLCCGFFVLVDIPYPPH